MSKVQVSFERIALIREKIGRYEIPRKIGSPDDAYNAITTITNVQEEAQEVFGILILNTKNKVVAVHEISRGSLNASIVHPREVYKAAILHNASSIICFHNHPSGDPKPSKEDIEITQTLVEAGEILGIKVLDHIIIGDEEYISLKEKGVM